MKKSVVDALLKFPKFSEDIVGIIKIAESIEAVGLKKSSAAPHNKVAWAKICSKAMNARNEPLNQHKRQADGTISNKGGT